MIKLFMGYNLLRVNFSAKKSYHEGLLLDNKRVTTSKFIGIHIKS